MDTTSIIRRLHCLRWQALVLWSPGTSAGATARSRIREPSSRRSGARTAASAVQGAASEGDRRVSTDLHKTVGGPGGNVPMSRGLWFAMNARTRRSLTLLWTALFLFSLALQSVQLATPVPALAAHNEGIFELDGNADDRRPRAPTGRTALKEPSTASSSVRLRKPRATTPDTSRPAARRTRTTSRLGPSRTTSVPDKNELLDAYRGCLRTGRRHMGVLRSRPIRQRRHRADRFLVLPGRRSASATADFTGEHVDGDVLVLSEYTNGGVVSLDLRVCMGRVRRRRQHLASRRL